MTRDEVILLGDQRDIGPKARLRRIEVWVEDKKENMVFVTNNLTLVAPTISAINKQRWQIELFFKALKQSLKVKTFVATSENAVQTQIWIALIALLRQQLFVYRDLFTWPNDPFQAPPALKGIHDDQMSPVFGG